MCNKSLTRIKNTFMEKNINIKNNIEKNLLYNIIIRIINGS